MDNRKLAIPADIVQRYFPESELVWNYKAARYDLETRDGYTIPTVEMYDDDENPTDQLWCWESEWPEVIG